MPALAGFAKDGLSAVTELAALGRSPRWQAATRARAMNGTGLQAGHGIAAPWIAGRQDKQNGGVLAPVMRLLATSSTGAQYQAGEGCHHQRDRADLRWGPEQDRMTSCRPGALRLR